MTDSLSDVYLMTDSLADGYQGFIYRTDTAFREEHDHRDSIQKVVDFSLSLFRQIQFSLIFLYNRLFLSTSWCSKLNVQKSDSRGLVVLIHGLHSDPVAWYCQLGILQKYEKIDVYAPTVTKRGLCPLKEAAEPILGPLLNYIQENPGKPLCLLGHSNGTRIATRLETQLRELAPQTPIKVSTIAGVHLGSSQMDRLEEVGLAKHFYPEDLRHELKYGSEKAKELLNQISSDLPIGCAERDYEFFAATEDLSVPDLGSSLPRINRNERFQILHGHSHDSIVTAVAQQQIASCVFWMDQRRVHKETPM